MIFKSDQYFESRTVAGYCVRLTMIETDMGGFKTVELVDLSGREFKMPLSDFKRAYYFGDDKTETAPPEEPNKTKMKIEVGKTYRVLKDYKNRGQYKKGDLLEITYIDKDEEYNRVDFLYNGRKSEFDSLEWIEKMELEEVVDSLKPAHYDTAIDPITFAKANFSREAVAGFMRISAIKYLQRDKGEALSDLRKVRHFIDMLIEMEEEK